MPLEKFVDFLTMPRIIGTLPLRHAPQTTIARQSRCLRSARWRGNGVTDLDSPRDRAGKLVEEDILLALASEEPLVDKFSQEPGDHGTGTGNHFRELTVREFERQEYAAGLGSAEAGGEVLQG